MEVEAMKQNLHNLRKSSIVLSNKAVQHLEKRDYQIAVHLLQKALSIHQLCMKHTGNIGVRSTAPAPTFKWSSKLTALGSKERERSIFSRGIFIASTRTPNEVIMAVVAYNAALTHHLWASLHNNSGLSLERAKLLYSVSGQALKQQQAKKTSLQLCKVLHLATLNNLGQVSFDLVDYRTSQKCFDLLRRDLAYIYQMKNRSNFCISDLVAMLFNTLLDVPIAAPCA